MLREVALLLLVVGGAADGMAPPDGTSSSSLEMYVDQIPQMPKIYTHDATTANLTVGMFQIKWKFHRDLPPTTVFAFGTSAEAATFPGPTIEALQGVPLHVTWENHLPSRHILPWDATVPVAVPKRGGVPTVVHLHGGVHPPQSDGSAMAWFTAGFNETGAAWSTPSYTYPNAQGPGVLWYHDHALGLTRVNLLAGLLGAYIVRNPPVEAPLGLPSGDDFDRVLVLADRSFNADGSIYMNSTGDNPGTHPQWRMEYFGDAITVNGKAWPFLSVARRRYRFRIINACNARYFNLSFTNGLPFHVVGSDANYLPRPVTTAHLLVAVAEAFDVVVDFAGAGGSAAAAEMVNTAPYPYPGGDAPNKLNGKVMKFVFDVTQNMTSTDNSTVPAKLLEYVKVSVEEAVQRRYIVFSPYGNGTGGMGDMAPMPGMRGMAPMPGMGDMPDMGDMPPMPGMGGMGNPLQLYINGKRPEDPVTETPRTGTTEVWEVINLTPEDHPIHLHLASIQAVRARGIKQLEEFTHCVTMLNDAEMCNVSQHAVGEVVEVPEHERTWKNVAKIAPGYMTTLVVNFFLVETGQPYPFDATAEPGYVYHCHILDHEDNAMVRPLKLIKSGGTSKRDRRYNIMSLLYIYLSYVMLCYCFLA